jgi:ech hydrogenase subunit D
MAEQKIDIIEMRDILTKTTQAKQDGYRLSCLSCTRKPDHFEISYCFDKDLSYLVYRIQVPETNPEIPSITSVYWGAFTYENEIHDLFGVKVKGINIDFQGNFYMLKQKTPFASMPNVAIVQKPAAQEVKNG